MATIDAAGDSPGARAALYSTVHGAGHLFGRKEAKRRFTRQEIDSLTDRAVPLIDADLDESPRPRPPCAPKWSGYR
jgi:tRNA-splicing ligase RtcB